MANEGTKEKLDIELEAPADFTSPEVLYQDLINTIRKYHPSDDITMIEKAYRIADNKLALNAGWDMQLLAEEVKELMDDDFDIDLLGFNDAELDEMLSDEQPQEEDDNSSPVVQIKYLAIDKERIPATDMEIALLLDVYRQYHDAHETHEGFVQYLANGCK